MIDIDSVFDKLLALIEEESINYIEINKLIYEIDKLSKEDKSDIILRRLKNTIGILYLDIKINKDNNEYYKQYISRLSNIKKCINKRKSNNKNELDVIRYLIYNDKDIKRIEYFIGNNATTLVSNSEDIFYEILNKYVDSNIREDINYLYMVIILFLDNNIYYEYINNNKDKYLLLLNNYKDKKYIRELIDKLNGNYTLSLDELENKYKVNFIYPKDLEMEMYGFKFDNNNRYDFTNQRVITIDHDTDTCLDDAIYIEKNKDGTYTLYVHIVDIAGYIPYNSKIFYNATKMGENLYLRDRVISIYPEYISNRICSILPNNRRNVITYKVSLDDNYDVVDFKILKGKIMCRDRLSYESANEILRGNSCDMELFNILYNLFMFSYKQRSYNNSKDIYREYHKFADKNSLINTKSDLIVTETMVLINHLSSKYFYLNNLPYIYRTLHICNLEEGMVKLNKIFNKFKVGSLGIDDLDDGELLWIYNKIKETFSRAKYSIDEYAHDGLGYSNYSRSTSPARRVGDAINQHLTYEFVFNNKISDKNLYLWELRLREIVDYLNKRKVNNDMFCSQYNRLTLTKK